jgi:hypothetical protein
MFLRRELVGKIEDLGPRPKMVSTWLILVGIFLPAVQISFAGFILTPGRIVTISFLIPALLVKMRRGGRIYMADFLIAATSIWSIVAVIVNGGFRPYVLVESLELLSGYMIGRELFFGRSRLQSFIQVLKVVSICLTLLALIDTLSGRRWTAQTVASLLPFPFYDDETQFRQGIVRATSTFPTAELYGLFCVIGLSIFLFSQRQDRSRGFFVFLSIIGCLLSVSSGPILTLFIVLGAYCYNLVFARFPTRWKVLRNCSIFMLIGIFAVDTVVLGNAFFHPFLWVIRNLTLDPWTGYWRIETWMHALPIIAYSPFVGVGFNELNIPDDVFLHSIDSVYLVIMWRFGIPAMIFLVLAIVFCVGEFGTRASLGKEDADLRDLKTGFTVAIVSVALIGLTLHLWDATWIFWFMCMGVRVSLREQLSALSSDRIKGVYPQSRQITGSAAHRTFGLTMTSNRSKNLGAKG